MEDPHDGADTLHTATEVWDLLVGQAGLEPEGWDVGLADEIRTLLSLTETGDVRPQLAGVAVERFVNAFFEAMEPFAQMMGDLLRLFEEAGIATTDQTAAIAFDFERGSRQLAFDLESFRRAREVWRRVLAHVRTEFWTAAALWALVDAVRVPDEITYDDPDDLARWLEEYESGAWPTHVPEPPRSGRPDVDERLSAVWAVWEWFFQESARLSASRGDLAERWSAFRTAARERGADQGDDDALLELVGLANSDHWGPALARSATAAAAAISAAPPNDADVLASRLVGEIDRVGAGLHVESARAELLQRDLEDVLELPFWKQRHELYSAWVLAAIVDAVKPLKAVLLDDDGVLHFRFKAAKMAVLPECRPPLAVWAELRTPLSDPLGESRTGAIQPDYSIVRDGPDPEPPPGDSLLEIECKQYKKPANRSFAEALADYARGRPSAHVLLVNHGRMSAAALLSRAEVRPVAERAHAISELHPRSAAAQSRFRVLVRGVIWPFRPEIAPIAPPRAEALQDPEPEIDEPPSPAATGAQIRLAWQEDPADLDLYLAVTGEDGRRSVVSYRSSGTLDAWPFAEHDQDVRTSPGTEVIELARLEPAIYEVAVHAFSDDEPLAGCGATVTLTCGDEVLTVTCPTEGSGRWWRALTLDNTRPTTVVQRALATDWPYG